MKSFVGFAHKNGPEEKQQTRHSVTVEIVETASTWVAIENAPVSNGLELNKKQI